MKIRRLFVPLAAFCAIAALVGCASTNRQVSESSLDETNVNRDGGPFLERVLKMGGAGDPPVLPANHFSNTLSVELSHQVNLNQLPSQKLDIDTDGAVTLDEWQPLDTSAGPKENFRALEVNGDGQINATEFLTQTPKDSKRYHFFRETDKTNDGYVSWDRELFQQLGWRLFSIRF